MMAATTPGSPTWYDVLGVPADASAEEIKAAWRQATDRFEPGSSSGQFRMFNEAADVLLDPTRRAAYDAMLAGSAPAAEAVAPTPVPAAEEREPEPISEPISGPAPGPREPRREGVIVRRLGGIPTVVLAVLAVLTAAAVVLAVVLGVKAHQQAAVGTARDEAPAAAEQAVKALFSYDYRDLGQDRTRAQRYLTGSFAKTYLRNFDALEKQKDGSPGLAVQTKAVVSTDVQGSGVVDVNDDGTVARVLVFVNVSSRKGTGQPEIFQNRVAMTMAKQGDRWLVDNVNSY
ncbi:MAG: DnaJ domain-containing protein [Marmoricola sp.]|nr:DnaJ domain-containing protein [Marmoricola sp.]